MAWFRTRREIAELRKQVAQLAQAINHQHQPAGLDIGSLVGNLIDGAVKQLGSTTEFVSAIHRMGTERMAQEFGRRGGRRRAATAPRDAKGRMLPGRRAGADASDCRLCDDPGRADFTIAEFEAHQTHKGRRRPVERQTDDPIDVEHSRVAGSSTETPSTTRYPLPPIQYPMVPAAERDEDSGTGDRAEGQDPDDAGHHNGVV